MAMNVNHDYSQFYAGTEQLKSYGSNPAAKKDTLVKLLDAPSDTKKDSSYADWKEKVEKIKLPATFQNVKYNGFQSFLESLQNQSSLSNSWISGNISRFMKWLAV